jgi:hypothetical protein
MKNPSIKRWKRRKVQDHKGETSQEEMIIENCYSSTRYLYLILQNLQKSQRNNQRHIQKPKKTKSVAGVLFPHSEWRRSTRTGELNS